MQKETRSALGKQGGAVAQRKRTGGSEPKTRQELYREAQKRRIPGHSKMGRDEPSAAEPRPHIRAIRPAQPSWLDASRLLRAAKDPSAFRPRH